MKRRVFVTGYGVITAIGRSAEENYDALAHGNTGFGKLDVLKTVHRDELPAYEIKASDATLCKLAGVPVGAGYSRTALLAQIAVQEAIESASLSPAEVCEAGLISATAAGGIRELETWYKELEDPERTGAFLAYLDTADPGEHTERLAAFFQLRRYLATLSTACSSSANAIILGARLIAAGRMDRILCGGSEALSKVALNGFHSLMILDRNSCRPFDENRNGLNLGEGAAYLVLESEEALLQSGRPAVAEIRGYANVNDIFHQTASSPDGTGALASMEKALAVSGLNVKEIDYINAHGTGTENNDLAEGTAIQALFGSSPPPFSSTKPYTGHITAAAGSVEAAFSMIAFQQDAIFPNLNFSTPMKELDIRPVTEMKHRAGLRHILSNSFGFGGNTVSLIFSKGMGTQRP